MDRVSDVSSIGKTLLSGPKKASVLRISLLTIALSVLGCNGDNNVSGPTPTRGNAEILCTSLGGFQPELGTLNLQQFRFGELLLLNTQSGNGASALIPDVPPDRFSDSPPLELTEIQAKGTFDLNVDANIVGITEDLKKHVEANVFIRIANRKRRAFNDLFVYANENTRLWKTVRDNRAADKQRSTTTCIVSEMHLADSVTFVIQDQRQTRSETSVLTFANVTVDVSFSNQCKVTLLGIGADLLYRTTSLDFDFRNEEVFIDTSTNCEPSSFRFLRSSQM